MVDRFFRDLTENRLRRGVFRSILELIEGLDEYVQLMEALDGSVDRHNESPRPFIWTAKANDILAKVMRAKATLNNGHSV